jgi:Caspase domain
MRSSWALLWRWAASLLLSSIRRPLELQRDHKPIAKEEDSQSLSFNLVSYFLPFLQCPRNRPLESEQAFETTQKAYICCNLTSSRCTLTKPFVGGSMRRYFVAISLFLSVLSGLQASGQTQRALIIGINTYQPAGTTAEHPAGCIYGRCELGTFENLEGSVNDAQAIADLLTSPKFGFPAGNVVLLTNPVPPHPRAGVVLLPADQTTRDGILAAMQKYLVDVPQKGDTVVFYDASHGSLRINSKGTKIQVLVNGNLVHADSTLVPSDAYKGGFDVRDREMTRIFNAALDKGVHLTVIFDSCHSGGATRGIGPKYRERSLAFDPRDIGEAPDTLPNGQPRPAPTERDDNPALVFSAAQQDQTAKESPPPDTVTEPHGAFTAALVEALQVLPANAPASVVYQRVKAVLEGNGVSDQEPDLDASAKRRQEPLFGGQAANSGKVLTAALKTDDDGAVWLDIGRVSGVGPGSEFTSTAETGPSKGIVLRVSDLQGIARSTAQIVSPAKATVAPGEIFELTKLVPAQSDPLFFWHWPSSLSEDEILAAAAEVKASGAVSVTDPAEEPWTDILSWDGTNWTIQSAGQSAVSGAAQKTGQQPGAALNLDTKRSAPAILGAKLTADALKQHLHPGTKLWVNLPAPKELAAKLALQDNGSAVKGADSLASANYILTGVLTADGPSYAWFHKNEFDAGPQVNPVKDHSPGCSATSQYPVRTDWTALGDATQIDSVSKKLNDYALRLGKVHGWFNLSDSATAQAAADYYKLTMVGATDTTPLSADKPARQGDRMRMALASEDRVTDPRWVYVLDIDCHGGGTLLYPVNYSENQFPNAGESDREFVLPHSLTLHIGPPYGVDTLILLSTAQPLPDPSELNFTGVASRGTRGAESPLQQLLANASSGTRGFAEPIPTNWGIDMTRIRSVPADATKQAQ